MSPPRSASTLYGVSASVEDARERVLRTAYDLFSRYGVQAIGVDRIIAEADVAKTTLYRHFRSKDDLVLAVLERREQLWTLGWLEAEVLRRADAAEARLLAIFDVFHEWFQRADYEGCLFTNSLAESHDHRSGIGAASTDRLANVRALVRGFAEDAGIADPDDFAREWQLLMFGSIVQASTGDSDAGLRARAIGTALLAERGRAGAGEPAAFADPEPAG